MRETKIFIGLNDQDTKAQRFETERYVQVLKRVCFSYHVPFSMTTSNGGYFHEDGTYTEENSLILSLVDADEGTVDEMARDLCAFFHQESVMVVTSEVSVRFVSERI